MNDITYRQGLRAKGFQITTVIGTATTDLSLSGLAKSFEFFSVINGDAATICTLTINNDVALDSVSADGLGSGTGITTGYPSGVPVPRRLTGQDTIQLRITDTGVRTINVVVWYRNSI
jgi:hypothetical protein